VGRSAVPRGEASADGERVPHALRVVGAKVFALAGLWEKWISQTGEFVRSCTIVTMTASEQVRPYHERMPVTSIRPRLRPGSTRSRRGKPSSRYLPPTPASSRLSRRSSSRVATPRGMGAIPHETREPTRAFPTTSHGPSRARLVFLAGVSLGRAPNAQAATMRR
jgi:hypothetical protein